LQCPIKSRRNNSGCWDYSKYNC